MNAPITLNKLIEELNKVKSNENCEVQFRTGTSIIGLFWEFKDINIHSENGKIFIDLEQRTL